MKKTLFALTTIIGLSLGFLENIYCQKTEKQKIFDDFKNYPEIVNSIPEQNFNYDKIYSALMDYYKEEKLISFRSTINKKTTLFFQAYFQVEHVLNYQSASKKDIMFYDLGANGVDEKDKVYIPRIFFGNFGDLSSKGQAKVKKIYKKMLCRASY